MKADPLAQLVETVLASPKYKTVTPDLIQTIGAQELARRRNLKEAVKATKNKLHQVGGAYFKQSMSYGGWLAQLRHARAGGRTDFLRACANILSYHTSTAERLPILDQFYATTLAGLPPIRTVIDVACGLNPLTIPWMGLPEEAVYYAYDIYQDQIDFLNEFMAIAGITGRAEARDVIQDCPNQPADLALVLKAIPCLEQIDKTAGARLLDSLNASYLLVSFPVHSLGGRGKGMAVNYEARFLELVAGRDWSSIRRFEFATELAFLVVR